MTEYKEQPITTEKTVVHEQPVKVVRKGSFGQTLLAGVLGGAITLGATQLPFFHNGQNEAANVTTVDSSQTSKVSTKGTSSLSDMIDNVSPAIVGVINMQKADLNNPFSSSASSSTEEETGTGSGVIYQSSANEAYIVTNNHVVEGASNIKVQLSTGKQVNAELIGTDALTDIAVLKIEGNYHIKPVAFADSSAIRTGDTVYAIGNPLGLDFSNSVTQGIVSAKERTMDVSTSAGTSTVKAIQTDAAINPGNSGGALLNASGQLIGINSMKISAEAVEGIGFAIPSNDVKTIIEQIAKDGKVIRPYMGVALTSVDTIPSQYREELGIQSNEGVLVADTDATAGKVLKKGDVITAIDGNKISSDSELKSYIYKNKKAGDTVTFKVIRDNKTMDVKLTLRSNENINQS